MRQLSYIRIMALGLAALFSCAEDKEKVRVLKPEKVFVSSPEQIVPVVDSLVRPVLYQNVPNLQNLPVEVAKRKFIDAVLPAILVSKYRIERNRERIQMLALKEEWTSEDSSFYLTQKKLYGAQNTAGLLRRMQTHPTSIVLAQAVVESGWGQSRFFQEGNNLFGIWSYRSDEPRMEARFTRGENEVHVRKYADVSESITDYFETIGRSRPYHRFRNARVESDQVMDLLPHLKYYSERRMEYVEQLQTIITQNDLTRYDHYRIDPMYMTDEDVQEELINTPTIARQDY